MDYSKLKSGTDIRGVAVEGAGEPVTLTDEVVETIAAAFLVWAQRHLGKDASALKIAIGHDSRVSADRISAALQRVFVRYGVRALDCGLASTPSMFWATLDLPCDCSVQITASHHPYHRNGLKFFTPQGGLDAPDITEILTLAQEGARPEREAAGTVEPCGYMKDYAARLRRTIQEGVQAPDYDHPLAGLHIVVDAGNGAGGFYAWDVLEPLGADISGSQFLEPDGMFPNHIPNPENDDGHGLHLPGGKGLWRGPGRHLRHRRGPGRRRGQPGGGNQPQPPGGPGLRHRPGGQPRRHRGDGLHHLRRAERVH